VKPDDALDDALDAQTSEPIADIFPHAPPSRDTRKFLKRAQKVHNHLIATNSAAPVDLMQEGPKVKYVSTTIRLLKPLMRRYTRLAKRLKVSRNELLELRTWGVAGCVRKSEQTRRDEAGDRGDKC
jgi:hypothetical protein